ncbi:MAG: DUF1801 domain-containing protein [Roseitalea sp.]|jgi:hypothetical protein|nr:DUF1801 domain-containing protein [Roseitalea sp.]
MKTQPTGASVDAFIASVENAGRREDAATVLNMMNRVTGATPLMWGDSLIGYGEYDYQRADGSRHRFFMTGFSPRKANLVIYAMTGVKNHSGLLEKLGPHRHSVSCLYLGRLKNIDLGVLEQIAAADFAAMQRLHPDHTL